MKTFLLTSLLALSLSATSSRADILYSQDFEALGNGTLAGRAGFTSNPGPVNVENGGLSYSGGALSIPGGTKNITLNATGANNWALINTFAPQSGTVYFSFSMMWTGQQADDLLFFGLSNDADTSPVALANAGGVVINGLGGTDAGRVGGRIRNDSSGNTTQTAPSTGIITLGDTTQETHFFIGSLSKVSSTNYNTLKLWVNPTTTTEGTAYHSIERDMGIFEGLGTFFFFTGASNESTEVIELDNIRIGTTYADVVIPEPSAALLMLVAGLGLFAGHRRRA